MIVILGVYVLLVSFVIFLRKRSDKQARFLINFLEDESLSLKQRDILYRLLPSYNVMLFKYPFTKLELNSFINQKVIDKIMKEEK